MTSASFSAEIMSWVEPVAGGWRYIFSSQFRRRMHESWKHEHFGYIACDIFWGALGVAASLAVAGYLSFLALK
jgi:hypothetical protein